MLRIDITQEKAKWRGVKIICKVRVSWRWVLIEHGMERKKQVDEKLFMLLRPILQHVSQG